MMSWLTWQRCEVTGVTIVVSYHFTFIVDSSVNSQRITESRRLSLKNARGTSTATKWNPEGRRVLLWD
ncbi:uncharacterized [Tachysurus ichikawai]